MRPWRWLACINLNVAVHLWAVAIRSPAHWEPGMEHQCNNKMRSSAVCKRRSTMVRYDGNISAKTRAIGNMSYGEAVRTMITDAFDHTIVDGRHARASDGRRVYLPGGCVYWRPGLSQSHRRRCWEQGWSSCHSHTHTHRRHRAFPSLVLFWRRWLCLAQWQWFWRWYADLPARCDVYRWVIQPFVQSRNGLVYDSSLQHRYCGHAIGALTCRPVQAPFQVDTNFASVELLERLRDWQHHEAILELNVRKASLLFDSNAESQAEGSDRHCLFVACIVALVHFLETTHSFPSIGHLKC